jgi:energy-coupling factor transporter ATP-binding protein EcfA2
MARTTTTAPPPAAQTGRGANFLSLTVENVRCFGPAQTLDLSDGHGRHAPWTVILGENNTGKTTLLTCLAAIPRTGYPGQQDSNARMLWEGVNLKSLFRGRGHDQGRFRVVVSSDRAQSKGEVEVRMRRPPSAARISSEELDISRHELVRDLLCFHYGVSRRMPQGNGLADYQKRVDIFLDDDGALRDPEGWLLRADYNARLRGADARRFETFAQRVRDTLIKILPEVADIRIQAADEPGGSPRVEAKTPDGWVPLRRLGFGYQSQIAWLVDFASRMFERYPDSPDPLAEPAIVLVDEIDLHMHPRWQRQIVAYLTERCPNTQFIVTAHSPLVVQAAADANIVLLRREVLSNWRVDQILTSELFGLDSARPPQIEAQLKERRALLAKPKLTSRDRKRLDRLQAQIGELPAGESAEDRRAMELIRRAASKLQSGA